MKVAIMGAGLVGTSLAKALIKAGHEVMLSSRDPGSSRMQQVVAELGENARAGTVLETLAFSEVVAVAMGWDAIPEVVAQGDWSNKIIIDMSNRMGDSNSPALDMARLTGGRVVKAFNTIGAEHYTNPTFNGEAATMFIAGDDMRAKSIVAELTRSIGFDVVDAGDLQAARYLEMLAAFWGHLSFRAGHGRAIAFKLLRR